MVLSVHQSLDFHPLADDAGASWELLEALLVQHLPQLQALRSVKVALWTSLFLFHC